MATKITTTHFTKIDDEWVIKAPAGTANPGDTVTVHLKNGAIKQVRTSRNFHLTEDGWDILREADRFEQEAERVQVGGTALHPIYADAQPTKATKAEDGRTATPAQVDRAHAILTAMNPTDMFDLLDTFTVPSKQDLAHMTRAEISDLIKEAKGI